MKITIVETYRREVEVDATDYESACKILEELVAIGKIDLPCDGDDYEYEREYF